MEVIQAQDKAKLRRDKTKQAITLALEGLWEEAVEVNREILYFFPEDVEALNRMGKARMELGHYADAEDAFRHAVRISPYNTIAKKNLERLSQLREASPAPRQARKVTAHQFIEETGHSGTTVLRSMAPRSELAKLTAGAPVKLQVRDKALVAESAEGVSLGLVEPRLALRLTRLIAGGNRYEGVVTSLKVDRVTILLKEAYRHPSQADVSSFPSSGESYAPYLRDSLLRYEVEDGDDDEDEAPAKWKDEEGDDASDFDEERGAKAAPGPAVEKDEDDE
jgi:tetratricopeptide (TPR) repeat protein